MPASTGPSPPYTTSPARPQTKRKATSKSQRPALLGRKNTSQSITKLGQAKKESFHEQTVQDDDDESFLNFCANCEKQIKGGAQVLYCSDSCRVQDQNSSLMLPPSVDSRMPSPSPQHIPFSSSSKPPSPPLSPFTAPRHAFLDGPDIVVQASPTLSTYRSRGHYGSDSTLLNGATPTPSYAVSVPSTFQFMAPTRTSGTIDALASLKELSNALEYASKTKSEISHSRTSVDFSLEDGGEALGSSLVRSGSAVWSYMTSSGRAGKDHVYTTEVSDIAVRPSTPKDRTAEYHERRLELAAIRGVERPLPPRTASYRPRSIDLLVPLPGIG